MVTSQQNSSVAQDISQWMDGEIGQADNDSVLTALKGSAGRDTWDIYHQIGDVLRDGAHCVAVSAGFQARFAEALAKEPTILAPQAVAGSTNQSHSPIARPHYRAWALAATVAGAAVIGWMSLASKNEGAAPQLAKGNDKGLMMVAATDDDRIFNPTPAAFSLVPVEKNQNTTIPADYLAMHQEYVPSTTIWSGVNAYQRVDGAWGYDFNRGQ